MEIYLAHIEKLGDNWKGRVLHGFQVAVNAPNKKQAKRMLRTIYPYKSYKEGYSIHIQHQKIKYHE